MAWKNVQYENGKMRTSSGGSGGVSNFADLEDVDLSNLQDGQVPKYNSSTQKWENANESGSSGHTYSTTEQIVGKWTDGRDIYENTVSFGAVVPPSKQIDVTSLGVDKVINIWGMGTDTRGAQNPISQSHSSNLNYQMFCRYNPDRKIGIYVGSSMELTDSFIVIQYVKST